MFHGVGDALIDHDAAVGGNFLANLVGFQGVAETPLHLIDQHGGGFKVALAQVFADGGTEGFKVFGAEGDLFGRI